MFLLAFLRIRIEYFFCFSLFLTCSITRTKFSLYLVKAKIQFVNILLTIFAPTESFQLSQNFNLPPFLYFDEIISSLNNKAFIVKSNVKEYK